MNKQLLFLLPRDAARSQFEVCLDIIINDLKHIRAYLCTICSNIDAWHILHNNNSIRIQRDTIGIKKIQWDTTSKTFVGRLYIREELRLSSRHFRGHKAVVCQETCKVCEWFHWSHSNHSNRSNHSSLSENSLSKECLRQSTEPPAGKTLVVP